VKFQKLFNFEVLRSMLPAPALAEAGGADRVADAAVRSAKRGGNKMFSSGSGDDRRDEYEDDYEYDDPPQSTRRSPGAQRSGSDGSGSGGAGGGGGRQRSVQFQPEERYWTEYLRIALPIVGLLLMIGLFWFWASQLAGNGDNGDDPISTQSPGSVDLIAQDPTPEPTVQVIDQPTQEVAEPPVSTPEEVVDEPVDPEPEETPVPDETETGEYAVGDFVVTTDGVNMRADGTTSADIVDELPSGEVLEILSGPVEADDYTWYEVLVSDSTNEVGWVASEFFEPAE